MSCQHEPEALRGVAVVHREEVYDPCSCDWMLVEEWLVCRHCGAELPSPAAYNAEDSGTPDPAEGDTDGMVAG